MAGRMRTIDVWKAMSTRSLLLLAFAVFLMFSVMGPLSILMESALHVVPWRFVAIQSLWHTKSPTKCPTTSAYILILVSPPDTAHRTPTTRPTR